MQYSTTDILEVITRLGYEETDPNELMIEILGEPSPEIKELADKFNQDVRHISNQEVKKIGVPITMRVLDVHDGNVILEKPLDEDLPEYAKQQPWTDVVNHTIFTNLKKGDEVLVGYYGNGQKSNCWIMFAKCSSKKEFEDKSIMKDINKIYDINDNCYVLKDLLKEIIPVVFPPKILESGEEKPNPTAQRFFNELESRWKDVHR